MESHDVILDHVSRVVYAEARGEPYVGKLAVAWVIKNRYNSLSRNVLKWIYI